MSNEPKYEKRKRNDEARDSGHVSSSKETGKGTKNTKPLNKLIWVNAYLDETDKQWLKANRDNEYECIMQLFDELPEGYTISSKFDKTSDRWIAVCICDVVHDDNYNHALSMRGASRTSALYALYYTHVVKLNRSWATSQPADFSEWG